jgi:branched-chain amino acid transport system substrate-binding protein
MKGDAFMSIFRVACCAAAFAAIVSASAVRAAEPPFEIPMILSLTGPASPVGAVEGQTVPVLESHVNKTGGIKGRPVKFVVYDDQSIPQQTVLLLNQVLQRKPAVVIGPASATLCGAAAPIVAKTGPVAYCLSPGIHPEAGTYVFSSSVSTADTAPVLVRYFREHGWTRIAVITSTDGTGQDVERQLDAILAMPENKGVQYTIREHFNPTDISVSAQMQRIRASNAQALLTWSTGTAFGTLLRGAHDAGLELPIGASNGNMSLVQMTQYKTFLPKELYFPGARGFSLEPGRGKVQDAQVTYFNALKAAGLKPDVAPSLIWDPTLLVVEAYRKLGTDASPEQIRSFLSALKGWAGVDGIYDFSDREHANRGLGQDASVMYRWDPDKEQFLIVSKVAGYTK